MKFLSVLLLLLSVMPSAFAAQSLSFGPAERPATIKLPFGYDASKKYPLLMSLHGLGNTKVLTDFYLGLSLEQDLRGFILILPEGTKRPSDQLTFWNATPECCDQGETGVDDAGYLKSLLVEATKRFSVDSERVYVYGHSNGGFMAHRLACENDGLIKGIVSVAGSVYGDTSLCKTKTPINVLQIHGDADDTVFFDVRGRDVRYQSAIATVDFWAERNACQSLQENPRSLNLTLLQFEPTVRNGRLALDGEFKDFVTLGFGKETDSYTYSSCADNTRTALWTIRGAGHAPIFYFKNFLGKTLDFLENNP